MSIFFSILFIVAFIIVPTFFTSKPTSIYNTCKGLKKASIVELVFAIIVFFGGTIGCAFIGPIVAVPLSMLAGMLWMLMAFHLQYGNPIACKACFYLSILRCFTIIGIPFSMLSFHMLKQRMGEKAVPDKDKGLIP